MHLGALPKSLNSTLHFYSNFLLKDLKDLTKMNEVSFSNPLREITTLLYKDKEEKQQDRIVKQFDKSHTVHLVIWMNVRMKLLSCNRKYSAWLVSALRRMRGWQMLQQHWNRCLGKQSRECWLPATKARLEWQNIWKLQTYQGLWKGICKTHFSLLALFEHVSKYGTNENCLPGFTWVFKTFSTGPKQEGRQSGTLLMRTSCHSEQTSWLSIWKNKYVIEHQVYCFQQGRILVSACT